MKTFYCYQTQKRFLPILYFILTTLIFADFQIYSQSWHSLSTGTNGNVYATAVFNGNLIAAGDFTTAGGVTINRIAQWNGTNWSSLGNGMDSAVYALTIYNGELIAGGKFSTAGGVSCNRIARWNGSNWAALGLGANASVLALSVYSGSLRAGGIFTNVSGVSSSHVARWDGSSWFAMGLGANDNVQTMTVYGADLILGGRFTNAGGLPNHHITRYNTTGLYLPLGSGIDSGSILSLSVYNGYLIVGGDYTSIGSIPVNFLASWDGTNWNSVGSGMNGMVRSLGSFDGNLIAGGKFTNAGGTSANYIASWNGTSWSIIGSGMTGGTTEVDAITTWSNLLLAGGGFTLAGGISAPNIAAYGSVPVAPTLINPCSITTDSLTPLLDWADVPNATSYGLQVAIDPNFLNIVINSSLLPISQYQIVQPLLPVTTYFWRANAVNGLGTGTWSLICFFTTPNIDGIINTQRIPDAFKLYQNYPNPFNPSTTIKFDIPTGIKNGLMVEIKLYDVSGKEISVLYNREAGPGSYKVYLRTDNLSSGVYFYKLITGDFIQTNKMMILK